MADYGAGRPMSVKELNDKAKEYDWNPQIGFKYWTRAAETIHHEGLVYLREGNLAHAYVVLMRYSTLVLDNLRTHPEAKEKESKRLMRPLVDRIPVVVQTLEALKKRIQESYDEWDTVTKAEPHVSRDRDSPPLSQYERHAAKDAALSWNYHSPAKILDAATSQEFAVDLANKEIRRRRHLAGLSDDEVSRRRAAGVWDRAAASRFMDDEELRRQMEATRRQLDRANQVFTDEFHSRDEPKTAFRLPDYYYPSINKSSAVKYEPPAPPRPQTNSSRIQPPRPPKEILDRVYPPAIAAPLLPDNASYRHPSPPPYSLTDGEHASREEGPPLPPKRVKTEEETQKRVTFRPAAYLENGQPLRSVFLPRTLRDRFLDIAADNTRKGLELCGLLCGTLVNNALFINCLLIPRQTCTPNTCDTEDEEGLAEYCFAKELIQIGWIHTHPTQTCFMSSRDIHTHYGFQIMMKESIAIVCAPKFEPSYGIFRLTHPPGLDHIKQCRKTGAFHEHGIPNDSIYIHVESPPTGHVHELDLPFDVEDLRLGV
ncbi:hypothetical protein B0H67DRAFT_598120 [Lasiosphaeris hirsuta]|uniref:MPN domain-containing protein n=1 Tax=Lasiosphaeris hirsuta TaxID=260670 RepID=A0AA40E4B8_9PEZI|nr:hypothetical protein B0H67DRAFT_598120 [Lasiosphaeris hirsuta]